MVDDENVAGEQERAAETEQRAQVEAEAAARHAQEVQTGQRDRDAAPVLEAAAAAEQQAEQRHDQNIARGHKTCLADRGVQQRELLLGGMGVFPHKENRGFGGFPPMPLQGINEF